MASRPGAGSSGAGPCGGVGPSNSAPPIYAPIRRRPTDSSHYSFNGTPSDNRNPYSQTWMYARDARNQQAGVPTSQASPYPSLFKNGKNLPLTTPGSNLRVGRRPEWLHYPLIPGRTATWSLRSGVSRGGVRSFYTDGNTNQFDVGYHDSRIGTSANGNGNSR